MTPLDPGDRPLPWDELERIIRRDPLGRGVASRLALDGDLAAAATSLADSAEVVGIVTGFCILTDGGPVAETDGPPGALFLARALRSLGVEVLLLTDSLAMPALAAGCDYLGMPREILREIPFEPGTPEDMARHSNDPPHNTATDRWVDGFLATEPGSRLTHLIATERAGPSHTPASVAANPDAPDIIDAFLALVPAEEHNLCYNMRGENINAHTAKAHRVFETIERRRLPIHTIGIGDGGNEIGMGKAPWNVLRESIAIGPGHRTACRIATDWTIVAGVSDWGAMTLAASVPYLRGARGPDLRGLVTHHEIAGLLGVLIHDGGCVDGVTKRPEPTVDSLAIDAYTRPIQQVIETLG